MTKDQAKPLTVRKVEEYVAGVQEFSTYLEDPAEREVFSAVAARMLEAAQNPLNPKASGVRALLTGDKTLAIADPELRRLILEENTSSKEDDILVLKPGDLSAASAGGIKIFGPQKGTSARHTPFEVPLFDPSNASGTFLNLSEDGTEVAKHGNTFIGIQLAPANNHDAKIAAVVYHYGKMNDSSTLKQRQLWLLPTRESHRGYIANLGLRNERLEKDHYYELILAKEENPARVELELMKL